LENNLAAGVFVPGRTAVLRLVASQAAIALENARLYRDVGEREAKIRRLFDANLIGTYIWKAPKQGLGDGDIQIIDANDAFLRTVGYDRADLEAGRITRFSLSPPEWRERDLQAGADVRQTGAALPFEKDYFRKDGSRVPVLVAFAAFDERGLEGFAFAVDLTELKRAEADAHDSERRYREIQTALAHAGRIATMGQITASIAHEVSQPVAGVITNAQTALRWLNAPTPDIKEVERALNRIVRDGSRAREVIDRVRALIKKEPPRKDLVELNDAVREVIDLTERETAKSGVTVQTEFASDLRAVRCDRVQLQQVVLNLIVNAIEAMDGIGEGPRELRITTQAVGADHVRVAISDSGPGLPDEMLKQRFFDAFHTTKPGGLGLGLSICRSIIDAHGGRLWASANAPRGAIFQFEVPVSGSDGPVVP
jgi:PAS domain S-box-containing protein